MHLYLHLPYAFSACTETTLPSYAVIKRRGEIGEACSTCDTVENYLGLKMENRKEGDQFGGPCRIREGVKWIDLA